MSLPAPLAAWHALVRDRNPAALDALLADDVVFHSPVVHTPQRGKAITKLYLMGAMQVLGTSGFRYVRPRRCIFALSRGAIGGAGGAPLNSRREEKRCSDDF